MFLISVTSLLLQTFSHFTGGSNPIVTVILSKSDSLTPLLRNNKKGQISSHFFYYDKSLNGKCENFLTFEGALIESKKSLKQFLLNWPPQMPSTFVIIKEMASSQNVQKSCKGLKIFTRVGKRPKRVFIVEDEFLHQVINTKMCTCL
jgi:hypothetical protein